VNWPVRFAQARWPAVGGRGALRVLVPGSGLGRLPYEIATRGFGGAPGDGGCVAGDPHAASLRLLQAVARCEAAARRRGVLVLHAARGTLRAQCVAGCGRRAGASARGGLPMGLR
jgi:hypothetical protein